MSDPVGNKRQRSTGWFGAAKASTKAATAMHDLHSTAGSIGNHRAGFQMGQTTASFSRMGFNRFPSDAIPANALGVATQFDTRWPGALVHTLLKASLEITIQNPSTTDEMQLVDPSIWFPRIEVMSNGAVADCVIYDIMWWISKMTIISDEERAQYSTGNIYNPETDRDVSGIAMTQYKLHNYDPPTTYLYTIPISGTLVVYAEFRTFLTDSKFFFPVSTVEPRLRIYTGNNLQTVASAAANTSTPNLLTVFTYLRGLIYDSGVLSDLTSRYNARMSTTRCIIYERQTFTIPINSGQEVTDQLLTAITGQYAWLFVIVSQAGALQNQIYSDWEAHDTTNGAYWKKLQDITLLDSNQRPWNFVKIPVQYINSDIYGDHFKSAIPFEKELNLIPFSNCCQLAQRTGKANGQMYMDGNWTLRFTPISNPPDNTIPVGGMNVQLIVLAARICYFSQTPGGGVQFTREGLKTSPT